MNFFRDENDLFKYASVPKQIMTAITNFKDNFIKASTNETWPKKLKWEEAEEGKLSKCSLKWMSKMWSYSQKQVVAIEELKDSLRKQKQKFDNEVAHRSEKIDKLEEENTFIKARSHKCLTVLNERSIEQAKQMKKICELANLQLSIEIPTDTAIIRDRRRLESNDLEPAMISVEFVGLILIVLTIICFILCFLYGYKSSSKKEDSVEAGIDMV